MRILYLSFNEQLELFPLELPVYDVPWIIPVIKPLDKEDDQKN